MGIKGKLWVVCDTFEVIGKLGGVLAIFEVKGKLGKPGKLKANFTLKQKLEGLENLSATFRGMFELSV